MAYYRTRGLRGSTLEELVNMANEVYRKEGIALVQKIPTPIKPVEFDSERRTISLAYFEQRSTVDYMGVLQGIPICFDAKETAQKNLPVGGFAASRDRSSESRRGRSVSPASSGVDAWNWNVGSQMSGWEVESCRDMSIRSLPFR